MMTIARMAEEQVLHPCFIASIIVYGSEDRL